MNKVIGQILAMIVLLISGIVYTVYNYLQGNTSQMMMVLFVGVLSVALINMIQGLIRAWRNREE